MDARRAIVAALCALAALPAAELDQPGEVQIHRDYERGLQRRGHAFGALIAVFGENVYVFDRIWYGMHDVTAELVQHVAANVDRIKAGG